MSETPTLFIIVGPNGSGKSSITRTMGLDEKLKGLLINPDLIAEDLDIREYRAKSIEAARLAERYRNDLLRARVTFGFETVGTAPEKLEFITRAKGSGYRIVLIFVTTNDPNINIERVRGRVAMGGHDVDPEDIVRRYRNVMSKLCDYIDIADEATVMDNSGTHPFPVFLKDGNDMSILRNPDTVPWVEQSLAKRYPFANRVLDGPFD